MHQTFAQLPDYDPETDQYNTLYRHYTPNGRWMRPDPLAGDVTNPQSLNRYAYVTNNPTSLTDSTGLGLPGCPQGMPDQWCYGGIPGFWAGGAQMFTFSSPTWDEFNSVFPMTFIPGENGDESELLSGSDLNGFLLLGITVLPLQTLSQLALLPHQVQQMQQNACTQPILDAVNDQFGTNFTPDNVQGDPFPNGQATNLSILATGLPAAVFNSIQTGRYPESPLTWVTGYGPTLHVTGQTYFDLAPATFQNNNAGGVTSVLFTAHIDSSFAYNPIGFLIHVIRDLLHIGGPRNPCP
jgi:RHS repeat-associated protein